MNTGNKRILFIAPLPPPVHGSAVVSQQIKDSVIINSGLDADYVNLSTSRDVSEIGHTGLWLAMKKSCRFVCIFFRTLYLLIVNRYDLCYIAMTCHGKGFLKDAPIALLCKLFGKKLVIHQHNKGMYEYIDRPVFRKLLPLVYRNAKVILLSWHLYPDIERIVRVEDVMVCPNGIKISDPAEKSVMETDPAHLLFLSNLLESKGVLVLLDALRILKNRGNDLVCNFIGGESKEIDATRFEREVLDRGLGEIVHYAGRRYGEEKEQFLKDSDIFVFPTFYYNECFPLVILEAMQYSLPVITTREGGIPDIVIDGQTGIIVEKNDPEGLADAIASLIEDPELARRMGHAGRKRLEENFTERQFEKRFTDILHTLLS